VKAAGGGSDYFEPRLRPKGRAAVGSQSPQDTGARARAAARQEDPRERDLKEAIEVAREKKTVVAVTLAPQRRFPMRVVCAALAVSRSNVIESLRRPAPSRRTRATDDSPPIGPLQASTDGRATAKDELRLSSIAISWRPGGDG